MKFWIAAVKDGKVKGIVAIPAGCEKEVALETAKKDPKVASLIEGKTLVKEIYVIKIKY